MAARTRAFQCAIARRAGDDAMQEEGEAAAEPEAEPEPEAKATEAEWQPNVRERVRRA